MGSDFNPAVSDKGAQVIRFPGQSTTSPQPERVETPMPGSSPVNEGEARKVIYQPQAFAGVNRFGGVPHSLTAKARQLTAEVSALENAAVAGDGPADESRSAHVPSIAQHFLS